MHRTVSLPDCGRRDGTCTSHSDPGARTGVNVDRARDYEMEPPGVWRLEEGTGSMIRFEERLLTSSGQRTAVLGFGAMEWRGPRTACPVSSMRE
jgi:hypothetical protein